MWRKATTILLVDTYVLMGIKKTEKWDVERTDASSASASHVTSTILIAELRLQGDKSIEIRTKGNNDGRICNRSINRIGGW